MHVLALPQFIFLTVTAISTAFLVFLTTILQTYTGHNIYFKGELLI